MPAYALPRKNDHNKYNMKYEEHYLLAKKKQEASRNHWAFCLPVALNLFHLFSTLYIQDVTGGKVIILGGYSVGHSKQKRVYVHASLPNGFQDRAISLYSSKTVDKKEILRTISNTGIYCLSDKVGTVYLV
jgi:hypothetical protein